MGMAGHTALADTPDSRDNAFERHLHPEFTAAQVSAQLKEKWVVNYSDKYETVLPGLGGGILMALFITTFFYRFVRPQVNYLAMGSGVISAAHDIYCRLLFGDRRSI